MFKLTRDIDSNWFHLHEVGRSPSGAERSTYYATFFIDLLDEIVPGSAHSDKIRDLKPGESVEVNVEISVKECVR